MLLAASSVAAQAEDRKCIREMYGFTSDMKVAKRQCDPKNFVTNPNEYGWVCEPMNADAERVKGRGQSRKRMRLR